MLAQLAGYYSQGGEAEVLLLDHPDLAGVTVAAAYSPYKRRAAYAGAAKRYRRSSDNAEQDIGFVGSELDTTALLAFVGAGGFGFATTWYDQSTAARNLSTGTAADQPRGVNSGSLETLNGQPTLRWLNSQLNFPAGFTQTLPTTVYAVVDTTALGAADRLVMQRSGGAPYPAHYLGGNFDYQSSIYWGTFRATWGTPVQRSAIVRFRVTSTETAVRVDTATEVTGATGTISNLSEWTSIGLASVQQLNDVPISELLIITSTVDAAADAAIIADYNARYGIF